MVRKAKKVKVKSSKKSVVTVKFKKKRKQIYFKAEKKGTVVVYVSCKMKNGKTKKMKYKVKVIKTKAPTDLERSKKAFAIQNQYRKAKGIKELQWSDEIYEFCRYRLKTSGYDKHDNLVNDMNAYFGDLAGYSLGRSDLVRRAMSKKKTSVMEKERQNFIYGNPEENVPGCISNGIDEKTANKIYDDMIDFAKYAFNKSHAACYAVVAYQTAYLKTYYPVEFMAALMTSVVDNTDKVAGYIYACRQMNIQMLPPDVNTSDMEFSVEDNAIRFGLSAVKSLGRPTIKAIIDERNKSRFTSMQDFISRLYTDLNKRTLENLIKSGAFDTFGNNRRQMMSVYARMLDNEAKQGKDAISGQMSLFDLVDESEKSQFEIKMPDVSEYTKEDILAFEKEVLGVYVSGHPLDEYAAMWKKHISAMSTDFEIDDETGEPKVKVDSKATIGGMIMAKSVKPTKTGQLMAYLTIEDLVGTVEVIVFPRTFSTYRNIIEGTDKLFITGRVNANADENAKLICESVVPFEDVPRKLWIRFASEEEYLKKASDLAEELKYSDGKDSIIIYCTKENKRIALPQSRNIRITPDILASLRAQYGIKNVETT